MAAALERPPLPGQLGQCLTVGFGRAAAGAASVSVRGRAGARSGGAGRGDAVVGGRGQRRAQQSAIAERRAAKPGHRGQPAQAARRPELLPKLAEADAPRLLAARQSRIGWRTRRKSGTASRPRNPRPPAAAPRRADAGEVAAAPFNSEGAARALKLSWEGRVQSHLARFRRYPEDASRRRRDGVVRMSFVVDADGRVLSSQQLAGSGTASLDREAAAMLQRAQPLPAPPADLLKGGRVSVSLPMRFELNES